VCKSPFSRQIAEKINRCINPIALLPIYACNLNSNKSHFQYKDNNFGMFGLLLEHPKNANKSEKT
jgi:hypothetical protein